MNLRILHIKTKKIAWLMGVFLLANACFVSNVCAGVSANTWLSLGYRMDDINWSIAGNSDGTSPNILSELSWKDLGILQLKIESDISLNNKIYIRSYLDYGAIVDGRVQDSDYTGDDRTGEFSRSNSEAGDGYVGDASVAIGYELWAMDDSVGRYLRFIPLVGYSFHRQSLTMKSGFQVIPLNGPFSGLNSTYEADWYGPWIGADLWFESGADSYFILRMERHWATYYAKADWNLRTDFQHPTSFEHEADGTGYIISLGWQYAPEDSWQYSMAMDYQRWDTDAGLDRTFLALPNASCINGGTVCETRLNDVTWKSVTFSLRAWLPF